MVTSITFDQKKVIEEKAFGTEFLRRKAETSGGWVVRLTHEKTKLQANAIVSVSDFFDVLSLNYAKKIVSPRLFQRSEKSSTGLKILKIVRIFDRFLLGTSFFYLSSILNF